MAIEYRQAKAHDFSKLLPLVEAYARDQETQMPVNTLTDNFMEFARSGIGQALNHPAAVVMFAEDTSGEKPQIVGYTVGMLQEPPAIFEPELYLFVSDLYVAPEYRKQGIGTGLIERLRGWGWVKGVYRLSLVLPHGSFAQKLYEKLGFKPVQTMMYYKEDAELPQG